MKKFELVQPSEDWLDGYSLGYKRGQMKLVKIMLEQVDATPENADGYTAAVKSWLKQIEQTLKEYK